MPTLSDALTPEAVRDLVSRLSDEDARAILIQQLDKVATQSLQTTEPEESAVASFQDSMHTLRGRMAQMVSAVPELPSVATFVVTTLTQDRGPFHIAVVALFMVIIFGAGATAEWGFRRLITRLREPAAAEAELSAPSKLAILALRLLADLLGIAVFAVVSIGVFFVFYQGHEPTRQVITAVFWAVFWIRIVLAVLRCTIAPQHSWLRIPPLNEDAARRIHGRLALVTVLIVTAYFLGSAAAALGVEEDLRVLIATLLTTIVLATIVAVVWADRASVTALILRGGSDAGAQPSRVRQLLAANWHVLVTAAIALIWVAGGLHMLLTGQRVAGPIIGSLCIIVAIPVVDWMIRATLTALLKVPAASRWDGPAGSIDATAGGEGVAADESAPEVDQRKDHARREYRDVVTHNLRMVLAVVTAVILVRLWGLDGRVLSAAGIDQHVLGAGLHIVVTLILASALWGIIRTAVKYAAPDVGAAGNAFDGEAGGTGGGRLQTLVPLLGKFMMIALILLVALVILSELGVNIGPLIAGAGVVGLAIGFGAQTLVKDIISGAFFLADDAFRIGEYIDTGSVKGTVEHISIRSLRLRHQNGPVNTIPFGEIAHLTNFSRDWSIMKLELRLPFETDLEKVRKLIKKVGQQLADDPVLGPQFLQPLKSQGVNRMDDSGFIMRVKFMAKPGEQFTLRREVFHRVQEAFAENGIRFAPRRVIVDSAGGIPSASAAAAAAALSEPAGEPDGKAAAGV
ncbi:MAG: mechanosensitive ion channel family protein [Rhodospirillales bacterium]|nr:mechanosensitive ion channel family protein [Rhodospirillales bacterium]